MGKRSCDLAHANDTPIRPQRADACRAMWECADDRTSWRTGRWRRRAQSRCRLSTPVQSRSGHRTARRRWSRRMNPRTVAVAGTAPPGCSVGAMGGMARWIDAPDLVSVARTGAASASMTVRRWPDPKTSPGTVPPPRLRRRCACIGGPQAAITCMRVRGRQGSQVRSTRVRSRSPRERKSSRYSRSSSQGDGNPPSPCSAPTRAPVIAATVSAS